VDLDAALKLQNLSEAWRIRDPCLFKHELKEKLLLINKVEQELHQRMDSFKFEGAKAAAELSYEDSIKPIEN
jgi:hypothetical protein